MLDGLAVITLFLKLLCNDYFVFPVTLFCIHDY